MCICNQSNVPTGINKVFLIVCLFPPIQQMTNLEGWGTDPSENGQLAAVSSLVSLLCNSKPILCFAWEIHRQMLRNGSPEV